MITKTDCFFLEDISSPNESFLLSQGTDLYLSALCFEVKNAQLNKREWFHSLSETVFSCINKEHPNAEFCLFFCEKFENLRKYEITNKRRIINRLSNNNSNKLGAEGDIFFSHNRQPLFLGH